MNNLQEFRSIKSSFEFETMIIFDKLENLIIKLEDEKATLEKRVEELEKQIKDDGK